MADRIVQPKVLASTNPDTYDNLIMQQAQNAMTANSSNNGIFQQSFTHLTDITDFIINNISQYDCFKIDIKLSQNDTTTVDNWQLTTTGINYQSQSNFTVMSADYTYSFYSVQNSSSYACYICNNGEDLLQFSFLIPLGIGSTVNLLFRRIQVSGTQIRIIESSTTSTFSNNIDTATIYYRLKG